MSSKRVRDTQAERATPSLDDEDVATYLATEGSASAGPTQ